MAKANHKLARFAKRHYEAIYSTSLQRSQTKGLASARLVNTWADTTTAHGRLMLTILGGLAEFERELIRVRTDEGRKRAQARGVRFGRKLKLTAHQIAEALRRREAREAVRDRAIL